MAKKSAASKGYRRTIKKKPFLTKNEIIILIAIVAAIIAGVVLFNLFYGIGYLKAGDLQPNDVVCAVSSDMRDRYVKIAEANDLDGFTRSDPDRSQNSLGTFNYFPDEPTDNISYISLGGSYLNAAELADSSMNTLQSFNTNGSLVLSERRDVTVQGHEAYIFTYTTNYYDETKDETAETETTEAETPESNVFNQDISLYVSVDTDRTVCVHAFFAGDDDSYYLTEDETESYILDLADKLFTVYEQNGAAA